MIRSTLTKNDLISYEKAKPWIYPQLSYREDESRAQAHVIGLTLSWYAILKSDDELYTARISKELLETWGVDIETITNDSLRNAQENDPAAFLPIESLIPVPKKSVPFYVLTNESRRCGANVVLFEDTLPNVRTRLGEPFYLIPSSIHEWLVIPKSLNIPPEEMNSMLHDINHEMVAEEETLGWNIFYFDTELIAL